MYNTSLLTLEAPMIFTAHSVPKGVSKESSYTLTFFFDFELTDLITINSEALDIEIHQYCIVITEL